jgi:hypothetical protein
MEVFQQLFAILDKSFPLVNMNVVLAKAGTPFVVSGQNACFGPQPKWGSRLRGNDVGLRQQKCRADLFFAHINQEQKWYLPYESAIMHSYNIFWHIGPPHTTADTPARPARHPRANTRYLPKQGKPQC